MSKSAAIGPVKLCVRLEARAHFSWVIAETAAPGGVCFDDILVRAHEEPVVRRGLGRSGEWDRPSTTSATIGWLSR
jgi:hypothetical protein